MDTKRRKALGDFGEGLAAQFLQEKGYEVVKRNYRVMGGELDIIARYRDELIFVEVKTRSNNHYGHPEDGVTFFKLSRMRVAAHRYLQSSEFCAFIRFDIVAINIDIIGKKAHIHHIKNFSAV